MTKYQIEQKIGRDLTRVERLGLALMDPGHPRITAFVEHEIALRQDEDVRQGVGS